MEKISNIFKECGMLLTFFVIAGVGILCVFFGILILPLLILSLLPKVALILIIYAGGIYAWDRTSARRRKMKKSNHEEII